MNKMIENLENKIPTELYNKIIADLEKRNARARKEMTIILQHLLLNGFRACRFFIQRI